MIGLSVMDILLGLVQHILLLLRLGGSGSGMLPLHQQTDAIDLFKISDSASARSASNSAEKESSVDISTPSTGRQELLGLLQNCIGSLATHVYYSDQISDMITAILVRLKPSPTSNVPDTVAAIQHPAAAAQAISDSAHLRDDASIDDFFSFGTAQVTALNAIRDVLKVANRTRSNGGAGAVGRNRVPIQVWEGTQWLLRDGDRRVRRSYVDTFLAWLDLEGRKDDARVPEHLLANSQRSTPERSGSLNRRALSNASQRGKATKAVKSSFFQLLYLAVYENALEDPGSAADILMLHLLLSQLVAKLGVNAVRNALPMIMRLQDDIFDESRIQSPLEKVLVGSLVHGYLWCISRHFDLENTVPELEIRGEILHRRKHGLWLDAIQIPPAGIDEVGTAAVSGAQGISLDSLERESMNRFQGLPALIDQVAQTYANVVASPPNSPPSSPGRVFSMPAISSTGKLTASPDGLPDSFKEEMASSWSREACINAADRANSRATSLHGSRSGTHRSGNNGLLSASGHTPRDSSPASAHQAAPFALPHRSNKEVNLLSSPQSQAGRFSAHETSPSTPGSSSDHHPTLRFDDLKRVLSGSATAGGALAGVFTQTNSSTVRASSPLRNNSTAMRDFGRAPDGRSRGTTVSVGSDSYVDAEGFESASEGDLDHPLPPPQSPPDVAEVHDRLHRQASQRTVDGGSSKEDTRSSSGELGRTKLHLRPRSSSTASAEDPDANARALKGATLLPPSRSGVDDDVPPVPPLPKSLSMRSNVNNAKRTTEAGSSAGWDSRPTTAPDGGPKIALGISSLGTMSFDTSSRIEEESKETDRRVMVQDLLNGIQVGSTGSGHGVGKPPY